MTYTIEKNFPPPNPRRKNEKYPFKAMDIGDSFNAGILCAAGRVRLSSAASQHASRYGKKFTTHKSEDGSVRCWRVA